MDYHIQYVTGSVSAIMRIRILCVGKLRETYWCDACDEYIKRLSRFTAIDIYECQSLPEPKNASPASIQKILVLEGEALLAQIKQQDHVIALCIEGKALSSEAFAERMQKLEDGGASRAVFAIGSSNGLSKAVLQRANETLSFSPMTFPHQMARVLLLEQLYRAKKMLAGETYHK